MSNKQARFERRLAKRREQQQEEQPEATLRMPLLERRTGEDRRVCSMTPAEVDDWLKRNGIFGEDRRKAERRKR